MEREILAGSLASSFTATLFSPLELVKTRLQVQEAPGQPRLYAGLLSAFRTIAAEEGARALWTHGFAAFVARDFLYSGLRIGLYPSVREALSGRARGDASFGHKLAAGAFTGALGASVATPLDVVRVRMSVEGGRVDARGVLLTGMRKGRRRRWSSSVHCFFDTLRAEGVVRGLWRGVGATMSRAALLSAGQLSSYDQSKVVLQRNGWLEDGKVLHLVGGVISGLVATTCCNPADVLKSRIMSVRATTGDSSVTAFAVARNIFEREGALGFMRGWTAAYARAGPAFFIQMPVVEALRHWLGVGSL
ncbi:hypothetical protein AB1Y20_007988 [Prymnesium parvum]|uniref:Uncharacterized protein n=1 Tax=Prymnesium parvum TaxID=97485 RepID=A0AB34ITQ1_PRYPA